MSEDKDELTDLTTGSPEEENDAHSNYQPETSPHDSITHHLSGMYQNWFLDYASYVILERAVPHINDGFKPVQRRILHSMKRMDDGRYNKVANIVGHTMQYPYRRLGGSSALYRGPALQIRPRCGVQPQNHGMETFIRWPEQGTGDASGQIPSAVGSRRGRHCRRFVFQNPAAQFKRDMRCRRKLPA